MTSSSAVVVLVPTAVRDITFNVNVEDINNRGNLQPPMPMPFSYADTPGSTAWSAEMPMDRVGEFDYAQTWIVPGPEGGYIEYKYFIVTARPARAAQRGMGAVHRSVHR